VREVLADAEQPHSSNLQKGRDANLWTDISAEIGWQSNSAASPQNCMHPLNFEVADVLKDHGLHYLMDLNASRDKSPGCGWCSG